MQFYVATLTPFDRRGRIDLGRLRAHVLWLIAKGVQGFVPTGTTGEFLYLSAQEKEAVHRTVLDAARGLPVYPCTWDPSPITTSYLCQAAMEQGASGALMPPPLYYELDDAALEAWYRTLRQTVDLPILAYHNPGYLPTPIRDELYTTLRRDGVLDGMKDSSRDPFRLQRLADGDPGAIYAGGDAILHHAHRIRSLAGFISAAGNLWPTLCLRIYRDGEDRLAEAFVTRVQLLAAAGGLRAMKSLLRMGCRAPLLEPDDARLEGLAPAEYP